MIPIGPILFFALRASDKNPHVSVFSERTLAFLMWLLLFPMVGGGLVVFLVQAEELWMRAAAVLGLLAVAVLAFPWPIVRLLFIPLGLVRASARLTRISLWAWGGDREGGSVVAGVMAAARRGRPLDDGELLFLEQRLTVARRGQGGVLFAQSLLARARGDVERARRLLAGVALLPDEIVPVPVRAWASETVIGGALARGDVDEARRFTGRGSARARLLAACAEALAPPRPPLVSVSFFQRLKVNVVWPLVDAWVGFRSRPRVLRARIAWNALWVWPRAPFRRLIADAQAALDAREAHTDEERIVGARGASSTPQHVDAGDIDGGADLRPEHAAVLWLARVRARGVAFDEGALLRLGEALDLAESELVEACGTDPGLMEAAADALDEAVRACTAGLGREQKRAASSAVLDRALDVGDTPAFDELSDLCERLAERPEVLPAVVEIEDWARLRDLFDAASRETSDEVTYHLVRDTVWNHAARIFNHGQKGIGRAMFLFLLDESRRHRDFDTLKVIANNLRST